MSEIGIKKQKNTSYIIAARFLLGIHIVLVMLFPVGGLLTLFIPGYIPFHLMLIGGTLFFHIFKKRCPLTGLEKKLLIMGRGYSYNTPCWRHYVFIGFFNKDVSDSFVKKFLIITMVLPSLLPLLYLLIKSLNTRL